MKHINQNTNYWTGNLTGSSDMWWREDEEVKKGRDVVALASYRSAIANYVNIVTGRTDIPVTYNSADESYTDGKKVYLSGSMNEKKEGRKPLCVHSFPTIIMKQQLIIITEDLQMVSQPSIIYIFICPPRVCVCTIHTVNEGTAERKKK